MSSRKNGKVITLLLVLALVTSAAVYRHVMLGRGVSALAGDAASGAEELLGCHYTVMDEAGTIVFTTGHLLSVGDEFIAEDDTHYRIVYVNRDTATAQSLGQMETLGEIPVQGAQSGGRSGAVAIYHTHSDESYEPTDGSDSKPGAGGIFKVGKSMATGLEKAGVEVIHSDACHDPHDAAAYDRSRRTAVQLLKKQPLALFDVHRDAGPAEPYLKEIDGQEVAKVMIVVGRTNPKMEANLDFARRLKDAVNSKYPGLVKGIFLGAADFNQDLYDRALLLEVGTEQTSRQAAEAGARIVGSVVPTMLGVGGPGSRSTGKSIGVVLGLTVAGTFVYLWISTGSWEEMRAKIMGWFGSAGTKIGGRGDEQ